MKLCKDCCSGGGGYEEAGLQVCSIWLGGLTTIPVCVNTNDMSVGSWEIKIAKIVDSSHVVLNKGSNDEVKAGQIYEVRTDPIFDPITNEILGHLRLARVRILRAEPRFSIAGSVGFLGINVEVGDEAKLFQDVSDKTGG